MKKIGLLLLCSFCFLLCACSKSSIVSYNISKKSDYFEIPRRIVFYNGITDTYLLEIIGYCSLGETQGVRTNELYVVCKDGEDNYKKHFLGLSDNTTYFVEQIDGFNVSEDFYRVIFKPSAILPSFEIQ